MPNRVELARPFAVVEGDLLHMVNLTEREAMGRVYKENLVRLTAERVEEPIPEAKSGWEWRVESAHRGVRLIRDGRTESAYWVKFEGHVNDWRDFVPPCDHAHVAELLRREGVE